MNITYLTVLGHGVHLFSRSSGDVSLYSISTVNPLNIYFSFGSDKSPQVSNLWMYPLTANKPMSKLRSRKHRSFLAVESSNEICHGTSQLQPLTGYSRETDYTRLLPEMYFKINQNNYQKKSTGNVTCILTQVLQNIFISYILFWRKTNIKFISLQLDRDCSYFSWLKSYLKCKQLNQLLNDNI